MTAPRVLVILGQSSAQTGQYHNQPDHWGSFASMLRASEASGRLITDDLGVLTPNVLAGFDVIVNASTALEPTAAQVAALLERVKSGAGFVGVHAATATFVAHPDYLGMIGARFGRHHPMKHFTIHFTDHDHPITTGLADYDHDDELYVLTADFVDPTNVVPLSGITVLAEAEGHPMVYVKTHGTGRVVYLASGHDARSLDQPTFRTLFNRAIAWAAPTQPH